MQHKVVKALQVILICHGWEPLMQTDAFQDPILLGKEKTRIAVTNPGITQKK